MKKKGRGYVSILLAMVMMSTPVFACTATPKANLSQTQSSKEANRKDQPKAEGKFTVDNFKMIAQALEKLGVSSEMLDEMIREGKNLPEVLEAQNIQVKKFKKVLLKEYYAIIKQGVEDGKLTKEDAKMLKYAIKQKIMAWLEP